MMKRIFAAILMLSLLFTLAACGKDKNPEAYELVNSAMKKTQALDSLDMKMVMNMSMKMEGVSMDIPITYDIKAVDVHSKTPKMAMVMSMEMMGMSVDMDFYMEDGYYYMSAMGQKMKFKAEAGDDYDALGQANNMMVDLDEKYLKDVAIVSGSNGKKTVTLKMDSDEFKKTFKDLVDSTGESAVDGGTVKNIDISNASVEITVNKDGYIDTYKLKFDMSMTVDVMGTSNTVSVSTDASIQYNNPGKKVTVTAPAGYKNYPEVDPDTLS